MALLDKWIALDMGAYLARFYDFSTQKQIVLKTIIAKKGKETLGVSDQALDFIDSLFSVVFFKGPDSIVIIPQNRLYLPLVGNLVLFLD